MAYRLNITPCAEEPLENLVLYIMNQFFDDNAAGRLLDGIDKIYDRLEDNPLQFPLFEDSYLSGLGIRKARVSGMDYFVVFSVSEEAVTILGFYHALENYGEKVTILLLQ